jgi:hypothetical protein
MDAERLVRVESGSGGPRVLRHQLQVAKRRDDGDQEGNDERHPHRAADAGRDLTGQRVDPGAENVTDHEQQEQSRPHHPPETRLLGRTCRARACGRFGHRTLRA